MRGDIDFGFGVFHSAVLRARLRRRRKLVRAVLALMALVVAIVAARPLLQGSGILVLTNVPPDAVLTLDGQSLDTATQPLSGHHTLVVTRASYYPVALDLTITRNQTTTLTVPQLRPRPAVQPIPLPSPGATWRFAMPDPAGGWRVRVTPADVQPTPQANGFGAANTDSPPLQVLRLDALGLTRLSTLEAYPAADELITAQGRYWAAWEPLRTDFRTEIGRLTITTPTAGAVMTTTAPVSGLWWAPGGRRLLIAARHGIGQDLLLWSEALRITTADTPLVTIPGDIAAVHWNDNGSAVVVLSARPAVAVPGRTSDPAPVPHWDATLIIPRSQLGNTRALRLAPPPPRRWAWFRWRGARMHCTGRRRTGKGWRWSRFRSPPRCRRAWDHCRRERSPCASSPRIRCACWRALMLAP
jgi:hypothetical protein